MSPRMGILLNQQWQTPTQKVAELIDGLDSFESIHARLNEIKKNGLMADMSAQNCTYFGYLLVLR